jgi:hypothetical protein
VLLQLIANVSSSLVGFMLICLAPQIEPNLVMLQRWRQRCEALAPDQVLAQVINTVQISCTSLAMALGYAAGARVIAAPYGCRQFIRADSGCCRAS